MDKPALFPLAQIYAHEANNPERIYLRQPIDGVTQSFTWRQVMDQARRLATFLHGLNLIKGDRVGILSKDCAHWFIADFAIALAGCVSVPLYYNQNPHDISYILQHANVKVLFVGKLDDWMAQENAIPSHIDRIAMPYKNAMPAKHQWDEIIAHYEPLTTNFVPDPEDIFTIFYTSGTTGLPKGAFYTYGKADTAMKLWLADTAKWQLPDERHLFCYLPLAHCFERIAIEFWSLFFTTDVSFAESIETFPKNLAECGPTFFVGVPRIWQVFQEGILKKLPQHKLDILLRIPLIAWLVKRKIKQGLGLSKTILCATGSAPLPIATMQWYRKIGILLFEGYGSTEDFIYATINIPHRVKLGSVGTARDQVELKLSENNELLVRSPSLMDGYYLDPKTTQETIDNEGFLHTGDRAEIDSEGFVFITGRLKDQFKTAKGNFIIPAPIEAEFAHNADIEQCCLIGTHLKQPILVANLSAAAKTKSKSVVDTDIITTLEKINANLTHYEQISKVYLVKDTWTPENQLLTPTLKMRRNQLHNKYHAALSSIENDDRVIVWEEDQNP